MWSNGDGVRAHLRASTLVSEMWEQRILAAFVRHKPKGRATHGLRTQPWTGTFDRVAGVLFWGVFAVPYVTSFTTWSLYCLPPAVALAALATLITESSYRNILSRSHNECLYDACYSTMGEPATYLIACCTLLHQSAKIAFLGKLVGWAIHILCESISAPGGSWHVMGDAPDPIHVIGPAVGFVVVLLVGTKILQPVKPYCNKIVTLLAVVVVCISFHYALKYGDLRMWREVSENIHFGKISRVTVLLLPFYFTCIKVENGVKQANKCVCIMSVLLVCFLMLMYGTVGMMTLAVATNSTGVTTEHEASFFPIQIFVQSKTIMWTVTVIGISGSVIAAMFTLLHSVQSVLALSCDGLLPAVMSRVWSWNTSYPCAGILVFIPVCLLSYLFPTSELLSFLAVSTIIPHVCVSLYGVVANYVVADEDDSLKLEETLAEQMAKKNDQQDHNTDNNGGVCLAKDSHKAPMTCRGKSTQNGGEDTDTDIDAIVAEYKDKVRVAAIKGIENPHYRNKQSRATKSSQRLVILCGILMFMGIILLAVTATKFSSTDIDPNSGFLLCMGAVLTVIPLGILCVQPPTNGALPGCCFRVINIFPWCSIFSTAINTYFLIQISTKPCLYFAGIIAFCSLCYVCYGSRKSHLSDKTQPERMMLLSHSLPTENLHALSPEVVPAHRTCVPTSTLQTLDTIYIH